MLRRIGERTGPGVTVTLGRAEVQRLPLMVP